MATMARGERPASFTHDIQRLTPCAPMSEFDYNASAELYVGAGRSGLRYRRFASAADAIRFAVEKLPAASLSSSRLEVEERHYDAKQIRALYDSDSYPLPRIS
jgi:hypothetical protein